MARHLRRKRVVAHSVADGARAGMQVVGEGGVGGVVAAGDLEEGEEDTFAEGGDGGGGNEGGEGGGGGARGGGEGQAGGGGGRVVGGGAGHRGSDV